ncbi:MAG: hypothetical protein IT262_22415, partial [Saprospiraceae bacterium]|nr:hypothetical protein [Saprospiraceae bacterium]
MKNARLFLLLLLLPCFNSATGMTLPANPEQILAIRSAIQKDSTIAQTPEPGEKSSKVAMKFAIIALAAALSFAVIGFQLRLLLAGIMLIASLVGLISGLSAVSKAKPKSKAMRRG